MQTSSKTGDTSSAVRCAPCEHMIMSHERAVPSCRHDTLPKLPILLSYQGVSLVCVPQSVLFCSSVITRQLSTRYVWVQEKVAYKEAFARLRELKQEIEHLQMLLEQSRTKLQKDFEQWMTLMLRQQQAASAVTAGALTGGSVPAVVFPSKPVHRYSCRTVVVCQNVQCHACDCQNQ